VADPEFDLGGVGFVNGGMGEENQVLTILFSFLSVFWPQYGKRL